MLRLETIVYREMPLGISRVLGVELVGVDFEGNPFVAAGAQESGEPIRIKNRCLSETGPRGLKPRILPGLSARLKPCPDTNPKPFPTI